MNKYEIKVDAEFSAYIDADFFEVKDDGSITLYCGDQEMPVAYFKSAEIVVQVK